MVEYKELRNHMIHDTYNDFNKYLNENVKIIHYIPLNKKAAIMDVFATNFTTVIVNVLDDVTSTIADIFIAYEIRKVFEILFEYTDIDFDYSYLNTLEYDLVIQSGLYEFIMCRVKPDYDRLIDYLDMCVGIRDISILELFKSKLNMPTMDDVNNIKSIIDNIDKDVLNKLSHIQDINNPLMNELVSSIKDMSVAEAVDDVKEKINNGNTQISDSET